MRSTTARAALLLSVVAASIRCGARESEGSPPARATTVIAADTISMGFDYSGAEALIDALARDSLSAANVDSLLGIWGVRAMVDNVTRYFPRVGEPEFRREITAFARTKRGSDFDQYFQLDDAWRSRRQTRSLVNKLRATEPEILRRVVVDLAPFQPRTGPLSIKTFFVAGGVSDGFVPDDTSAANFYANLARANGDYDGVAANVVHEAYHVMQKAAQRRIPGLVATADSIESRPAPERLLATTLAEGTAKYVVEPGARHWRDTRSARVRENFAVFDTVLAGLRSGSVAWDAAYLRGFTSTESERFYFVGYEMTKAIDRYCGHECIGRLFERQPIEFFREYLRLYREHPEIVGRFAPATEAFLAGTGG